MRNKPTLTTKLLALGVGFLVVALTRAEGRRWLLSPWPWLALAVFAIALLPHLAWLRSSDFATLGYAMDQGGGQVVWGYVLRFALAAFPALLFLRPP